MPLDDDVKAMIQASVADALKLALPAVVSQIKAAQAGPAAPAVPAKESETSTEYVLYLGTGDQRYPLYSDEDLDVVMHHKAQAVLEAKAAGKARPTFSLQKRVCTFQIGADGKRRAPGSTCTDTELDPATGDALPQ